MTVRDLLDLDISIDVTDNVCEELYIAFEGPMALTEEGLKKFGEILDLEVTLNLNSPVGELAIVNIDNDDERVWNHRLRLAKKLFEGMAGYCTQSQYDKWFMEG